MVADGMNKGGLPRDPILNLCEKGQWALNEKAITFSVGAVPTLAIK